MVQAYQDPKRSLHPRLYPPWREASSIDHALRNGFVGLGAGLFSACVKNAYSATTTSAVKVITIYGSTIPIYGAAFAAYGFTSTLASNLRRRNDSINEFWGGASGAFVWSVFRRHPIPNIITISIVTGLAFQAFSWAGGLGGYSMLAGVDPQDALQYRRDFRYYPTNLIPMSEYEKFLGRKATFKDFQDLYAILGDKLFENQKERPTDVMGMIPGSSDDPEWFTEMVEQRKIERLAEKEKPVAETANIKKF